MNNTGTFELKEGTCKNIGFYMEDLAGNVTDSRKSESAGNVAEFKSDVTVSTNFFVRFYNNKAVFYPVAGGGTAIIAGGGGTVAFLLRRRRLLSEAAKAAAKVIK